MLRKLIARLFGRRLVLLANIAEGAHADGCKTYLTDAAQSLRHALVMFGTADHVAVTTADTDIPLGVCNDEADAAEDVINVQLLGQKEGTILVVAQAAIGVGAYLVPAAAGRVQTIVGLSGVTTYIVGRALNAASSQGDLVEMAHCGPVQRVIA